MDTFNSLFFLEPTTHVEVGENEVLFLNVECGEYLISRNRIHINFAKQISNKTLRNVCYSDIKDEPTLEFMTLLEKKKLALSCFEGMIPRRGTFQPHEYIIEDICRWKNQEEDDMIMQGAPSLLSELTIYLSGQCGQNCPYCDSLYKQIRCCNKYSNTTMEVSLFDRILQLASNTSVGKIHLVLNLEMMSKFDEYDSICAKYSFDYNLWITIPARNYTPKPKNNTSINYNYNFVIPNGVHFTSFNSFDTNSVGYHICVSSQEEMDRALWYCEKNSRISIALYPIWKDNIDFLAQNVLLNEDEILDFKKGMQIIRQNKRINANCFGTLHIFANGDTFAAPYSAKIGNVTETSLSEIVYNELKNGSDWLKTRNKIEGCSACSYNSICPPLSYLEAVSGFSHLCNV